jgi:lysozyme
MSPIVPPTRPNFSAVEANRLLLSYGVKAPAILGSRGYYRDTMGAVGKNDRGIYDDAIVVITPSCYKAFNANCDPSIGRPGMAVLAPGAWDYKLGIHNLSKDPKLHPHYEALVQAAPVSVNRDGGKHETGYFGINIHKGGYNTTSSEGCQTIYPDEWDDFIATVKAEIARYALRTIPYVLTEWEAP